MNKLLANREVLEIAHEIGLFCKTYGRINVRETKEEYGLARVRCDFNDFTLNSVFFPGTHSPTGGFFSWIRSINLHFIRPLVSVYRGQVYRYAYLKAIEEHPEHKTAIIGGMDRPELINYYIPKLCGEHYSLRVAMFSRVLLTGSNNCDKCKE